MPVQQQMSGFAKKLGGRVAAANAEHADKPVDTGNRRLPSGIRDGVAKLSIMYTKEYEDDKSGMKGQTFFRASATVMAPAQHNGEKVSGLFTSVVIPLCDKPAKGQAKAVSFDDNWFEFQNLFKLLGIAPPVEPGRDVAAGERIQAYYFAAMKMLTDPTRMKTNPVYISFSTRGWTPPPSQAQSKPEEMVFETWHGLADFKGTVDPGAWVSDGPGSQPPPMTPPPSAQPSTNGAGATQPSVGYDRNDGPSPEYQPSSDPADVVAALVEAAMNDPEGATTDGAEASSQLEQMAWAAGWSKEQTAGATDWVQVGDMALAPVVPATTAPPTPAPPQDAVKTIVVGGRWWFAKRSKAGEKLKDGKGQEFPPQEVEVVAINDATKTCTLKTVRDSKDVLDIRTKKPVEVKYEWLELPPY